MELHVGDETKNMFRSTATEHVSLDGNMLINYSSF
jgi:hypothetical protein